MIRRIAVLTGDDQAPGMNVVIRAVTRAALHCGWEVMGVCDGYNGLVTPEFIPLTARTVDDLLQWGSTMLGGVTSRHFSVQSAQKAALEQLANRDVNALIVVGGDETQANASALAQSGYPVIGIAASVENDLAGFDSTVGVDSAMNVALDSLDHLRLASPQSGTAFVIEVAGRRCGSLALMSGIAGNADLIVIPEVPVTPEQIAAVIRSACEAGKTYPVIVMAEGAAPGIDRLKRFFEDDPTQGYKVHVTRLAYLQRHAAPSAGDRLLGMRLGAYAVDALARGEQGVVAGSAQGVLRGIPFADVVGKANDPDPELIRLANILSLSNLALAPARSA